MRNDRGKTHKVYTFLFHLFDETDYELLFRLLARMGDPSDTCIWIDSWSARKYKGAAPSVYLLSKVQVEISIH